MPESFLGDGLIFEELLPLQWFPGALPEGLELARLNADNHQLLGAESTLEEVRVSEALSKEESSALVHELQRLEYKLNVLLRLTADLGGAVAAVARTAASAAECARGGMVRRRARDKRGRPGCCTSTSIAPCRSLSRFPASLQASACKAASASRSSRSAT